MSKRKKEKSEEPKKEKARKAAAAADAAGAEAPKPRRRAVSAKSTASADDIAQRAYYIAEHRHRHGHHGDAMGDWVEAERQLREEGSKKKKIRKD